MLIDRASLSQTGAVWACGGSSSPAGSIATKSDCAAARCIWDRCVMVSMLADVPFWYTVLALSEIKGGEAKTELKHAAPALERTATRAVPSAAYARRRHELAVRTLNGL